MEVVLFDKTKQYLAHAVPRGAVVHFDFTDLLGAIRGDDGNALHIVVNEDDRPTLLSIHEGQLRTCDRDRILRVIQAKLYPREEDKGASRIRLKDMKPGSTFSLSRLGEDEDHYMVTSAKPSSANTIRAYNLRRWSHHDFDSDRHVILTKWVCQVIAS